jgi:hypothetical protein
VVAHEHGAEIGGELVAGGVRHAQLRALWAVRHARGIDRDQPVEPLRAGRQAVVLARGRDGSDRDAAERQRDRPDAAVGVAPAQDGGNGAGLDGGREQRAGGRAGRLDVVLHVRRQGPELEQRPVPDAPAGPVDG